MKEWNAVVPLGGYIFVGLACANAECDFHHFNHAPIESLLGEPYYNLTAVGCDLSTFHMWKWFAFCIYSN